MSRLHISPEHILWNKGVLTTENIPNQGHNAETTKRKSPKLKYIYMRNMSWYIGTFFSGGKLFSFKNMAAANDDVKISSYREDQKSIQYNKL